MRQVVGDVRACALPGEAVRRQQRQCACRMAAMELQIGGEGGLCSCSVGWQPWSPNLEDERMLDSVILIEEDKCMFQ